jgi:hypothetical protein
MPFISYIKDSVRMAYCAASNYSSCMLACTHICMCTYTYTIFDQLQKYPSSSGKFLGKIMITHPDKILGYNPPA